MVNYIGTGTSRVDGRAKVTGEAKYAGEFNASGLLYGSVIESTIPKGRIARIDASEALRVEGVIEVLTHQNRPRMAESDDAWKDDVAPEEGSPSVRFTTTRSSSAASRLRWCWLRSGKSRATLLRWCGSSMKSRHLPLTCIKSATGRLS